MKKNHVIKGAVIAALLLAGAVSYVSGFGGPGAAYSGLSWAGEEWIDTPETGSPGKETDSAETGGSEDRTETPETGSGGESAGTETPPQVIWIHVCGEVENPGVFALPEGSRIYEAVELAGGFTGDAAEDYLNLAAVLSDGEQVRIPDREEALRAEEEGMLSRGGREQTGAESSLLNINTATKEQLMTLPGIGEAKASAIILYREEHGEFKTTEDIMKVPGIKQSAFDKIKDSITV